MNKRDIAKMLRSAGDSGRMDLEYFDKHMAVEIIEDALTNLTTPNGRGMATGLCGAFYLCGLLSAEEWKAYLKRIPAES